MRDAQRDLGICAAATKGPWRASGNLIFADSVGFRVIARQGDLLSAATVHGAEWQANARFIVMSREALPYYITRVQELEAEAAAMRDLLEDYA